MTLVTLTPIDQISEDPTTVRTGSNRKWKVIALILAIICLALITVIIVMAYNRKQSCDSDDEPITTTTEISMKTTVDFTDENLNSPEAETGRTPMETISNHASTTLTTVKTSSPPFIYTPNISDFTGFKNSSGLSLNHSIYFHIDHLASFNGYVINVSLRLFTNWEGDNPLYIYSISRFPLDPKISHRYPLIPQRNNTEWQTIEIPFGKFSLSSFSHLAIGMQDNSDTNQIYAVKAPLPMYGANITSDTNIVYSQLLNDYYGAAFTFTLFKNEEA